MCRPDASPSEVSIMTENRCRVKYNTPVNASQTNLKFPTSPGPGRRAGLIMHIETS